MVWCRMHSFPLTSEVGQRVVGGHGRVRPMTPDRVAQMTHDRVPQIVRRQSSVWKKIYDMSRKVTETCKNETCVFPQGATVLNKK